MNRLLPGLPRPSSLTQTTGMAGGLRQTMQVKPQQLGLVQRDGSWMTQ